MDHHLRGPVALPPATQCYLIGRIRLRVGLKQGNELNCRELVACDPAQNVVARRGQEGRNGVDTVRSIQRRFSWRVSGGHRFLAAGGNAVVACGTTSPRVEVKVAIDLRQSRRLRPTWLSFLFEEITN